MMWFYLGCQNFIVKKSFTNDSCDIFVSDFVRIWHKSLSNNELILISQSLNPLLEASLQKLKDIILNLLEDVKAQKSLQEENDEITLNMESNILGLKFQFQVLLKQANSEVFFQEFTLPLLIFIKDAQNRDKKLMKIIEDKDEELAEYKKECGYIKSCFKATKPFIKKEFNNNESESIPWNHYSFLDSIKFLSSEKLSEVEQCHSELKKKDEECMKEKKCDKAHSAFSDNSITKRIGSKPCVRLDNQIIKKKKREALKLNF